MARRCNHRNPGGSASERTLAMASGVAYYCTRCGRLRIPGGKTLYPTMYIRKRKGETDDEGNDRNQGKPEGVPDAQGNHTEGGASN